MSTRAQHLHATADGQLAELSALLTAAGEADLGRPCPGRRKLGDGSVGAVATHTIENYHRIARFVAGAPDDGHRRHDPEPHLLLARLGAARVALANIGRLSDEQLDAVPAAGEIRFADGARTREEIVASLLRHQRHQVDALAAALSA